jgi:Ni/Co efflux regulator RcnB
MRINRNQLATTVLVAGFALFANAGIAQNRGHDDNNGRGRENRGEDRGEGRGEGRGRGADNRDHADYRFRGEDRDKFRSHYQSNLRQVEKHADRRHHVRAGDRLPSDYRSRMKSVPSSYYRDVPPPPPGYRLGYYDGYVVAYNPTTQIIADVLDLVNAVANR